VRREREEREGGERGRREREEREKERGRERERERARAREEGEKKRDYNVYVHLTHACTHTQASTHLAKTHIPRVVDQDINDGKSLQEISCESAHGALL